MITNIPIKIAYNKKQLIAPLFGALVLLMLMLHLLTDASEDNIVLLGIPYLVEVLALICFSFFGFIIFIFYKKISDQSPALIINDEGITDNTNVVGSHLITWDSIEEFCIKTINKHEFILIMVKNPEAYIQAETKKIVRYLLKRKMKKFQTPFVIVKLYVETDFTALSNIMEERKKQIQTVN